MTKPTYKLNWSDHAKTDLRDIYNFIKEKSVEGAKNVIADIRKAPRSVHYPEQMQVEPYAPECRRIVAGNYKILYTIDDSKKIMHIIRVFDTRQDPEKMSS